MIFFPFCVNLHFCGCFGCFLFYSHPRSTCEGLWRENGAISWIQSPLHKHMPRQSHGLAMDKQREQGSEPGKKKNPTDKRHRPGKQKNVSSTARGKLARKRKTWSKSGAGTNYPRHSAPIPKRWLSEEELSKGSSPATTKFPAQLACAEPHGPAKCE